MFQLLKGLLILLIIRFLTFTLSPWKYFAYFYGSIVKKNKLLDFIKDLDLFFLHPSIDPDYLSNPNSCISVQICLKGNLDIPNFFQKLDTVLTSRREFGKLKQHVKWIMGIGFWCWDPVFDFQDHVSIFTEYEEKELSLEMLSQLSSKPFFKGCSMWNMNIYKNGSESSIIYFRCHHSICDGDSLLKLLRSLTMKLQNKNHGVLTSNSNTSHVPGLRKSVEKISAKLTSSNTNLKKPFYYSPIPATESGKIYFTRTKFFIQSPIEQEFMRKQDLWIVETVLTGLSLTILEFLNLSDNDIPITMMKPYNLPWTKTLENERANSIGNYYGVEFFNIHPKSNLLNAKLNVQNALSNSKSSRLDPRVTKILTNLSNNIPKFRSPLFILPHSKFAYPEIIVTYMRIDNSNSNIELKGGGIIEDISYWVPAYHNGIWCSVGIFNNFGKLEINCQLSSTVVKDDKLAGHFEDLFQKKLKECVRKGHAAE